jgi:acyl-CoA thioesterase-1
MTIGKTDSTVEPVQLSRRSLLLLLAGGCLAVLWWLRSDVPTAARPTGGEHIIAFGDSLVAGRGASAGRDFPSVLSQRLGTPIINAGRNGDTTARALARLDRDVLARNPRIVIVLLGGNDFLRRVPVEETFQNLESIVVQIRQRGAAVVLVGVGVGLFFDSYGGAFEALSKRTSAVLVPDILDGIIAHADLMADAIHPNDRGYAIIADRLESSLRDLMRSE